MYHTQTQQLNRLSKGEYIALREMSHLAKNMYNVGLYNVRQYFFETKKRLNYNRNYHDVKNNENYKMLNSNIAQQMLKEVDSSFKSFFGLLRKANAGEYPREDVKIPGYLKKDGYATIIIGFVRIKDGVLEVPMSWEFKDKYGSVKIKVPSNLKDKKIKEIRIIPKYNARFFEIHYAYEAIEQEREINVNNALAVDLGINNIATCVTNNGSSFIIDGRRLKSINQWYNKQNARYQSIKDKQDSQNGITLRQAQLAIRRNNQVRDYINKTASIIIKFCLRNDIGILVVGYSPEFQRHSNMGRINNQSFVNIPLGKLVSRLEDMCKFHGIVFVKQEESYTSKASFFDNDDLPVFDGNNDTIYTFSGRRISRGQYRTSSGQIVNSDINGALNILRKSKLVSDSIVALQDSGFLDVPTRIRVA